LFQKKFKTVYKRCPHKIAKIDSLTLVRTNSNPFPVVSWTQIHFRKSRTLLQQKVWTSTLEELHPSCPKPITLFPPTANVFYEQSQYGNTL